MNNLSQNFGTVFPAIKAFVFRKEIAGKKRIYVEAYDFDDRCYPINAHPLTVNESNSLSKILNTKESASRAFLKPKGLMPKNILFLNPDQNGSVVWYTPVQRTDLFFHSSLEVPDGKAFVPPMIWKATKTSLKVFAIKQVTNINPETQLYNAPFYNIYTDGKVCMGTVKLDFSTNCCLEDFMKKWEVYFFNSYFKHHIDGHNPMKENLLILWKSLMNSNSKFPVQRLTPTGLKLKKLLL